MNHCLVPLFAGLALSLLSSNAQPQDGPRPLFDGESLEGWSTLAGDAKWWSAAGGVIRGGSLEENIPHNTFLSTQQSFHNFELRLKLRLEGSGGLVNSGVQVRSVRVEGSSEMSGYQVDAGDGWWGKLYDESRRNRVIAGPLDAEAVKAAVVAGDWNEYVIRAEGSRLRSWINGVAALDYTEPDNQIPLDGHIGLQVHSGGRVLLQVKDVTIEELPATPNAMTWRRYQKAQAVAAQGTAPVLSAAEQLAGFDVLEGFEVELVASDPAMNKVVDIAFDDAGRMWAITAVEYPIDGNESGDVAEMYRRGGRDQVLVFDEPWKPGPQEPRVFADGLFMPMALLPTGDGLLLGMGPEILRLRDEDGDGRADSREVVLKGFGIQDSHLLPHRFVRAPGGWVYLAQGAFNSSKVETKSGEVVSFNKCKLGRFQNDGSRFEVVGMGLNNIWGFVIDRLGDKWIQEANDLGYPLVPFEHYRSYPGIGMERFHDYSPWHPPCADFTMGGTGLSGLALSQDRGGFPEPWNETFFLANPILSSVPSIRARRDGTSVELERVADLLVSADKNFRPVAIHFGPDGCLYIVDWYNPIISHNEVARDHPSRDKTSTRIWRIRHESQAYAAPLDVTQVANADLVELLSSKSTWTARAAWHQITDRKALELSEPLAELARDPLARGEDRVLSLWCLEDLGRVELELVRALLVDKHFAVRREAARLSAELGLGGSELAQLLSPAPGDVDPRVRLAAIHAASAAEPFTDLTVIQLLSFLRALPDGPRVKSPQLGGEVLAGLAADIAFERSLVRSCLEQRPELVIKLLDSASVVAVSAEGYRFALLCAGGVEGAQRLAPGLLMMKREPSLDEFTLLAQHADHEEVGAAFVEWLGGNDTRITCVQRLLDSKSSWQNEELVRAMAASARSIVADSPTVESRELLLRVARELRCAELEPDVIALLDNGEADPRECVRALIELGCRDAALFHEYAAASLPGEELRRVAVAALAEIPTGEAFEALLELWPVLERGPRQAALAGLLQRAESAARLVAAIGADDIGIEVLDASVLARLEEHLGNTPELEALKARVAAENVPVLRLGGAGDDYASTQLTLEGAFTIEAWVRLAQGITNADGLLCQPGVFDLNFHDARLRLWLAKGGDVIIATRRIEAETWAHFALTRSAEGELSLYVNGELDVTAHPEGVPSFSALDVGRTGPGAGTDGWISELRVWSVERDATQLGLNFKRGLRRGPEAPKLVTVLPGDELSLAGNARLEGVLDAPPILSEVEAAKEAELFAHYRRLANTQGDVARGRELFVVNCAVCHRVGGEGADIGPILDGVAAKGREGLLRSILTPNAGVESGYRTLIVRTTAGELLDGFLAEEDAESIVLRRKDREDLRLPRAEIVSARFDSLSLMPSGLLEGLSTPEVTDLLSYVQSLH